MVEGAKELTVCFNDSAEQIYSAYIKGTDKAHSLHLARRKFNGVDPDYLAVHVEQSAAAVARIDGGVNLNQRVAVCFNDSAEQIYSAYIKGTDPSNDLAVVGIKLSDIPEKVLDTLGSRSASRLRIGSALLIGMAKPIPSTLLDANLTELIPITSPCGLAVSGMQQLKGYLQYYRSGETVEITVKRLESGSYTEKKLSLTLGERPEDLQDGTQQEVQQEPEDEWNFGDDFFDGLFRFPQR